MRQKATDYLVHRTPAAVQSPARITAFLDKLDAFARAKEREPFDALEKLMFVNVCPRGEGSVIPVGLLCAALFLPKAFTAAVAHVRRPRTRAVPRGAALW
jgi:hypothetical protein